MPRVQLLRSIAGAFLHAGLIVEIQGPVSDEIHKWLLDGDAELLHDATPDPPPRFAASPDAIWTAFHPRDKDEAI